MKARLPFSAGSLCPMHITRIRLENIKSYREAEYTFGRGTIAITGPNGAGKTTIIEAIAWALFNVLDYKKDDFVRRGARRGKVEVAFISSLDEREYTVVRDTGNSYFVVDEELGLRVADKTNEVGRFLRNHLGVEPGTDLESLFRQAIGVPQGTLTAVFLAPAAERKRTFDALLKVDEYRRGADELLKTVRFLERSEAENEKSIARAEGEITASDGLDKELAGVNAETESLQQAIAATSLKIGNLRSEIDRLEAAEEEFRDCAARAELLSGEAKRARLVLEQAERNLRESLAAEEIIVKYRADALKHQEAVKKLAELERERSARDQLQTERIRIDAALTSVKADLRHYEEDLREIRRAVTKLAAMKEKLERQVELERQLEELRAELAVSEARMQSAVALQRKVKELREEYRTVNENLRRAELEAAGVANSDVLRKRETDVLHRLARARAELEHKQQLKVEIREGLCPILSQKCLNLKPGETLEGFIIGRFEELNREISELTAEQAGIEKERHAAEAAERAAIRIGPLREQIERIKAEGKALNAEVAELSGLSEKIADLREKIAALTQNLNELGDPRSLSAALESQIRREPEIREKISQAEKNREKLETEIREIDEQLAIYADFDARLADAIRLKDETEEAYRLFLANENVAKQAEERRRIAADAEKAFAVAEAAHVEAQRRAAVAEKAFDKISLNQLRSQYVELENSRAADNARLNFLLRRKAELEKAESRVAQLRRELDARYRERSRLERIRQTAEFIRETLRDAAPLIARNYVFHVSAEANNIFREITGIADRTLKWAEDYSIIVEEGGYLRPFGVLSGGEQMAAALSVRLALLKQLTGIRIAFFDEPTANLDAGRRENLAMQVGSIRHFDQLFVISHDDTFEGYLDHEIRIGDD